MLYIVDNLFQIFNNQLIYLYLKKIKNIFNEHDDMWFQLERSSVHDNFYHILPSISRNILTEFNNNKPHGSRNKLRKHISFDQ